MNIQDQPLFAFLKARLDFLSGCQKLIAENIANATTPGFTPRDMDERAFNRALERAVGSNDPNALRATRARVIDRPDSERTFDGNAVVLEEQTLRAAETRMSFETSLALYQKNLQLLRLAARPPGR